MRFTSPSQKSAKSPAPPSRPLLLLLLILLLAVLLFHRVRPSAPPVQGQYDLPGLLGVSSFARDLSPSDEKAPPIKPPAVARDFPGSILAHYLATPSICSAKPLPTPLRAALLRYARSRSTNPEYVHDLDLVRRRDTLLIHLSPDPSPPSILLPQYNSLSDDFLKQAAHIAANFSSIIILPTLAPNSASSSAPKIAERDLKALRSALPQSGVRVLTTKGTDEDFYFLASAERLLVHRGPLSALAALAAADVVYTTPDLHDYTKRNAYKWLLRDAQPVVHESRSRYNILLDAMGPVKPSCCKFEPYGTGDGEKIVCANARKFKTVATDPCWILSIGCGNRWHFEQAIVKRTKCHVHTFDCTGSFKVPSGIAGRVTVHKLCLGHEGDERDMFVGWSELLRIGQTQSNGPMPHVPVMVKMDVEGWEFPVLQTLHASADHSIWPEQIAFEVHSATRVSVGAPYEVQEGPLKMLYAPEHVMGGLFRNLSDVGYDLVHRADNPFCDKCSEVTMVKRDALPAMH